ncbi:hypothetical protein ACI78V_06040 [Geodermatophilus sp. SYSU D00742]
MNRWVQRGLRTALLTGGLLATGTGIAAADDNDLTADLLGVTATVPVQDGTVLGTPVVTGTGEELTVGAGAGDGLQLPVDTDTAPGTTVLGDGGVSVPVRVTEADGAPPDPADGLTVTVPVNTSGGGTAGTTVTAPVVTGDLGDVLDGDPLTGDDIDVDLAEPLRPGPGGEGLLLDLEDTVTIGDTDGTTARDTVLELPAGLDADRPSTVALPLPGGPGSGGPLSRVDVDVTVGGLLGDGHTGPGQSAPGDPVLSLPIDTGGLLPELLGGDALREDTVDVDLGGLLGGTSGDGSAIEVPVDEGGTGTGSDLLVRVTLPVDLSGLPALEGQDAGAGDGSGTPGDGDGNGPPHDGNGTPVPGRGHPGAGGTGTVPAGTGGTGGTGTVAHGTSGSGTGHTPDADPASGGHDGDCGDAGTAAGVSVGGHTGNGSATGGTTSGGPDAAGAPGRGVTGSGVTGSGDACGTGTPQAVATQPRSSAGPSAGPLAATAGALAVVAGLLLAAGRGRPARNRA